MVVKNLCLWGRSVGSVLMAVGGSVIWIPFCLNTLKTRFLPLVTAGWTSLGPPVAPPFSLFPLGPATHFPAVRLRGRGFLGGRSRGRQGSGAQRPGQALRQEPSRGTKSTGAASVAGPSLP